MPTQMVGVGGAEAVRQEQEHIILLGDRVQALLGTGLSEGKTEYYKAGDQGTMQAPTVEEVDVDATGAARFIVERARTGGRTFMLHHVAATKIKVIGEA